ncbi:MAG: substrate-binding domain-containing protein [Bacteroidales bacterium]|nr:substrate-binding domain-containing protein [Bacteroidales bacterium]
MSRHPITIKDIAKILSVSVSTVSRALKDHPDISKATKKAVQDLAKELNYRPNEIALSLKNRRSKIIGIMVPKLVHHFFSSVIEGVENVAYENGYQVMIYHSDELLEREIQLTQSFMSYRLDGLIVSMSKETDNFDHFKKLSQLGVPIVYFDRVPEGEYNKVLFDDYQGAFDAVKHMIDCGCKKIVHFGASPSMDIGRKRISGYLDALKEYGLETNDNFIINCDSYEGALKATEDILYLFPDIDGIFAVNDLTALGSMKQIQKLGKKVPEDIKVMGFTNEISSAISSPSLSTVDQQGIQMGEEAASLLLDNMDGIKRAQIKTVRAHLVIRESTCENENI